MPATPLDSQIYRDLLGDEPVARLYTDAAEIRAMMLVEGALARVQGDLGLIPRTAAAFLHRAMHEAVIDPAALAAETGRNGVPVPALLAALRQALGAPDHTRYLHWGATSQDIVDTALALRLRQVLMILDQRLAAAAGALGALAEAHADLPVAGRTYGQLATPTSFGAVVASWGAPLLRHRQRLAELRPRVLLVSLAGAAGTLSAMGTQGPAVRAGLAEALGLGDPGGSRHAERDGMAELAAWLALVCGSLGKLGEDLILLAAAGEVRLPAAGGSSTMPQKQNPVLPSLLAALARMAGPLAGAVGGAAVHRQQRDAAAWMVEWLALPQLCLATGRALTAATTLAQGLEPVPEAMARSLDPDGLGLAAAEALSFALADTLPRPDAVAETRRLVVEARASGTPLNQLAAREHRGRPWDAVLAPARLLGTAPAEARAFAAASRER